ncbi:MAG: hypothetical protein KBD60_06990 [Sterolibacterium sp.]|jgi:hypothetical protein|nr:hypothetical protein [Sterolibacterium sp.]
MDSRLRGGFLQREIVWHEIVEFVSLCGIMARGVVAMFAVMFVAVFAAVFAGQCKIQAGCL